MESFLYITFFVFAYCYFFFSTASTHPSLAQRKPPRNPLTIPTKTDLRVCVCLDGLFTSSALTQIDNIPIDIVYSRNPKFHISVLLHLDVTRSGASNSDQITQTHSH